MTVWDGRGLPPLATARLRRFGAGGPRPSLLSIGDDMTARGGGLVPVGEVLGVMVSSLGWAGWGGCGYYGIAGLGATRTVTSGGSSRTAGFRPYVDALYRGYRTALDRLVAEAVALGADGVVGTRVSASPFGQGSREFRAVGTAVRADTQARPDRPFVTHVSGAEVVQLTAAGWVPVTIALGISVAVRHDDWATVQQSGMWAGNAEVSGYTDLVQQVRADARRRFADATARAGADGAIVSGMTLHIREQEQGENHRDHIAESTVTGTALARFRTSPTTPPTTLTVLPLRPIQERPA